MALESVMPGKGGLGFCRSELVQRGLGAVNHGHGDDAVQGDHRSQVQSPLHAPKSHRVGLNDSSVPKPKAVCGITS